MLVKRENGPTLIRLSTSFPPRSCSFRFSRSYYMCGVVCASCSMTFLLFFRQAPDTARESNGSGAAQSSTAHE